ncbi:hypothetical protein AN958_12306 [Leucoagaricus sp. SymC.cos]|nr:hypothetical protein AN958_12306 [Leucoagaricus sp. SymC.cos]
MVHSEQFIVAGLIVNVFSLNPLTHSSQPLVALFFLHGRHGSAEKIRDFVGVILEKSAQDDLMVITFDHRNHGTRLRDAKADEGWSKKPELTNDRHARMISTQAGTARDVSFLIDFLPAFLFPTSDRSIRTWGIAGKSLGGHSTWLALVHDKRISFGIPIIGCPDYLKLMRGRAARFSIPVAPPYFPTGLLDMIARDDPAARPFDQLDASNPFLGRKILVLSGGADKLVPWDASKDFVEALEVGLNGVKKTMVYEGVGHECTKEMLEDLADFVVEEYMRK